MVPDHAEARVLVKENMTDVIQNFEYFVEQNELQGESTVDSGILILTVEGKSGSWHGSFTERQCWIIST